MSEQRKYRFAEAYPAMAGYGPAMAVTLRDTGQRLGYVRRIAPGQPGRPRWMVYGYDGSEWAIADQRLTAANFLLKEAKRTTPPTVATEGDGGSDV